MQWRNKVTSLVASWMWITAVKQVTTSLYRFQLSAMEFRPPLHGRMKQISCSTHFHFHLGETQFLGSVFSKVLLHPSDAFLRHVPWQKHWLSAASGMLICKGKRQPSSQVGRHRLCCGSWFQHANISAFLGPTWQFFFQVLMWKFAEIF